MASLLTHPVIPIAIAGATGLTNGKTRLLLLGIFCSMIPDADAAGYFLGVPYAHVFGHRGFSHSIIFAAVLGVLVALRFPTVKIRAFIFIFLATISHGLLDALTSGGLGVGFFIPYDNQRYFFPTRPIRVSPIGISAFFSDRGLRVFQSELLWVWLPAATVMLTGFAVRRVITRAERT